MKAQKMRKLPLIHEGRYGSSFASVSVLVNCIEIGDGFLLVREINSLKEFSSLQVAIDQLLPWMFALDHVHYVRWLSIHLYDMQVLNQTSPDTYVL